MKLRKRNGKEAAAEHVREVAAALVAQADARVDAALAELGAKAKEAAEQPAPKAKQKRLRPRSAKGSVVGLSVGAAEIAAARVANNGSVELLQLAREPLARGVVVAGEVRDPAELGAALKDFFRKHKLPTRNVRLGVANDRIGVRVFELEGIDDPKQLENAVRFRAQAELPIPVDQAVLDYRVLEERPDDAGGTVRRVLLVVAYRELVDRYVEACRQAGVHLMGIDLEAFALLRVLAAPDEDEAATVAVAVGGDRSTFAVSSGRVCEFTRVLEWGTGVLDAAPADEAMRAQTSAFAREVVSSLHFYQSQPGALPIARMTLTGGSPHLPVFAAELRRLIGVPVEIGDPLARVHVRAGLDADGDLGSYAIAIGLGIED